MCEQTLARLATGQALDAAGQAHAAACPSCQRLLAATSTRPVVQPIALPSPSPAGLRARARRRTATRVAALAMAATALIALLQRPGADPTRTVASVDLAAGPDLIGLLNEVDQVGLTELGDLPGAEALALLDPLGAVDPVDATDALFFD